MLVRVSEERLSSGVPARLLPRHLLNINRDSSRIEWLQCTIPFKLQLLSLPSP
jgi:hypothetical protein